MYKRIAVFFYFSIITFLLQSQTVPTGNDSTVIDFSTPKEYEIGGVFVSGSDHLDQNVLSLLSGLSVGEKVTVPGDKFSTAIENLWKQGLFEDVKITVQRVVGSTIYINIIVLERPRLSKFLLIGMKKSEADDLRDKIKLIKGKVLTDGLISSTSLTVKEFFIKKGYQDVTVDIKKDRDPKVENTVILTIKVTKGAHQELLSDATLALIRLGYNQKVAETAIKKAMDAAHEEITGLPKLITSALKNI